MLLTQLMSWLSVFPLAQQTAVLEVVQDETVIRTFQKVMGLIGQQELVIGRLTTSDSYSYLQDLEKKVFKLGFKINEYKRIVQRSLKVAQCLDFHLF